MGVELVAAGQNVPDEINVIIEVPMGGEPIKYEMDKASGTIFVDRVLTTPMRYPCNYGYVPQTLSEDGDPVDAMVLLPIPLIPGAVIRCRPIGIMHMEDEHGIDTKVIVVPADPVYAGFHHVHDIDEAPKFLLDQIAHFFQHYKELEPGKWSKVGGWDHIDAARQEIRTSIARYQEKRHGAK